MGAYTSPSTQDIADTTGANMDALGLDAGELTTLLQGLTVKAEADLALEITEGKWESTSLSAREVVTMQEAVCWAVAARYLRRVAAEKDEGTYAPLLQEDSRSIAEIIAAFQEEGFRLIRRIAVGPGEQVAQIRTSWSPCRTPTFTREGPNW